MKKFLFTLLFLLGSSFANFDCIFRSEVQKKDTSDIVFRKERMNALFVNKPVDWSREGIFLFVEQKNDLRLFIIGNDSIVELFQYPRQTISKWLNPIEYLKEREEISKRGLDSVCHSQVSSESNLYGEMLSLSLENYPMIYPALRRGSDTFYYQEDVDRILYLGYVKQGPHVEYFRFRDFRQENMPLEYPLNTFEVVFFKLSQYPFSIILENCK